MLLQRGGDLLLLAIPRLDLRPVAVQELQAQPRGWVVAPAAVAALQRGEPGPHPFAVGQLLAQLQRQLAQQVLGLVDQMLAAREGAGATFGFALLARSKSSVLSA